jgi:hypothetical protein
LITLILGRHLLPPSILGSEAYAVLLTFVAINTVMYAALSVAKMLPKLHPGEWISRLNRRGETRSIYPDARR